MRIGFLLGAGVSIPAGKVCTDQLTQKILQTNDYAIQGDECFCPTGPDFSWRPDQKKTAGRINSLLQILSTECQSYFEREKEKRKFNYEDLFFAANQLQEHLAQEYENPAIEPFVRSVLKRWPQKTNRRALRNVLDLACRYIHDVIVDLPPFLTQMVKTQNPLNGELSHGVVTQAVHEGV